MQSNDEGNDYKNPSQMSCRINNEVRKNIGLPPFKQDVKCLFDDVKKEIYVPFTFVKKYFDVSRQ